ncbi:MAG: DUF1320 domain-containing protein [Bryobacterales bacterium]|nr:DUF1320 domain-containing protein [Bryobacterales bacterium]
MAYATVQDCIDRQGAEALRELADDAAAAADAFAWTRLEKALDDASDEIDAYIGARHRLPLDPVPRLLTRLCVEIGAYRRAADAGMVTEEIRDRYDRAIRLLKDIEAGKASLGAVDPDPPADAAGRAAQVVQVASGPARVMDRDSVKGMF